MNVERPTVSLISALIVLIPLPWHWRTRNICTSSIMFWLAICNVYRGINAILWADTVVVKYKIWCDIVVKLFISSGVGVPASVMCICRRLAQAASPYSKPLSSCEKRQRMRFEIGVCMVLPTIFMMLHIIVQPSRFIIQELDGCTPTIYRSIPALLIVQIPPVLLSLVGTVHAGIALRWLIHRRVQFQQASSHVQPMPITGQYLRLVSLAITLMTFATVMSLSLMVLMVQAELRPWTSWDNVHKYWREIEQSSRDEYSQFYLTADKVSWYFVPIASVTVFSHFGFDDRAISEYKSMLACINARVFCTKPAETVALPLSVNGVILSEIGPQTGDAVADEARNDNVPLSGFPTFITLA